MARQSNGIPSRRGRGLARGGFGGRGRGGRAGMFVGGRIGPQKPPPLMSRPMPPPSVMRPDAHRPVGPLRMPLISDFGRMGLPRMPLPLRSSRGTPNMRMIPRGRGARPPLRGRPLPPSARPRGPSGLLPVPPPMPMPGPPMFRHRPPIPPGIMRPPTLRGRGMPGRMLRGGPRGRGLSRGRGASATRKGGKPRGRGGKAKDVDKILTEATNQVSDKEETKQATADSEVNDTTPKVTEGAEPMEEEGGRTAEVKPSQDPEVEMTPESCNAESKQDTDSKTKPESESEGTQ